MSFDTALQIDVAAILALLGMITLTIISIIGWCAAKLVRVLSKERHVHYRQVR
jgi:hypothetical protein